MKNILKNIAVVCLIGVALVNCKDMNYMHDKYLKDGEIIYVAMFDSMKIFSGIERMVIHYWLSDPQVKYVEIKWDLGRKSETFEVGLTTDEPGIIEIKNIDEGQVSFELINLDVNKTDKSVITRFTVTIYGFQYQEALDNRIIKKWTYEKVGDPLIIYWVSSFYGGCIGTEIIYLNQEGEECIDTIARPFEVVARPDPANPDLFLKPVFQDSTVLDNVLDGSELMWRNIYLSETDVDAIASSYSKQTVRPAIKVTGISLDYSATAVEQKRYINLKHTLYPEDADNKAVIWSSSDGNIARVSNGMVTGLNVGYVYITVRSEDDVENLKATCLVKVNQNGFVDLDRSEWYVAPETDLNGDPIEYSHQAGIPSNPSAFTLLTAPPVWNKKKSPYLSHFLGGSTADYPGSGDARISPRAHIDNFSSTYLGMNKGSGTTGSINDEGFPDSGTTNWAGFHRWGGMWITTPGEKPWFIIRLNETEPQKFNYFRIRFRENGSLETNNKPHSANFFGSNDDNCIENEALWIKINDTPIALANSGITTETIAASLYDTFAPISGGETGNQNIGDDCEYKYIKVQFESWAMSGNTICVAEFYLGWRDIDIAP